MKFTEEQRKAVELSSKNILVSAAAGSGKTMVLVERIRKKICEEGIGVRNLLVVTFTNAAAAEMKDKIRRALREEVGRARAGKSSQDPYIKFLSKQITDLQGAAISTFHAFLLTLIRRFFFMTELEPGFSVCDDTEAFLLKEEALDELIRDEFGKSEEDFLGFMDSYSSDRNPNRVREIILKSHSFLLTLPEPAAWLDEQIRRTDSIDSDFAYSELWVLLKSILIEDIERAVKLEEEALNILESQGLSRMAQTLNEGELTHYKQALAVLKSGSESGCKCDSPPDQALEMIGSIFDSVSVTLRPKKEEKVPYEEIKEKVKYYREKAKDIVKEINEDFCSLPLKIQLEDIKACLPDLKTLARLLTEFEHIYRKKKREKGLIDFNDIEHTAFRILQNDKVAEEYRERFSYILIDEYQDTNIMQEAILDRIRRDDNLFMVGDIKQSIYRFRLADPDIFREKYEAYSLANSEACEVIDLNKNFRSKKSITSYINEVFSEIMDGYDQRAALYPGISYGGPLLYSPECHIVLTGEGKGVLGDMEETGGFDLDLIRGLKSAEIEAAHIGNIIKENLGKEYFDHKEGKVKRLRAGDMVILVRSIRQSGGIFRDTLYRMGINSVTDDNEGYFDTVEIEVFMNLLAVIDNRLRDIELISVLHSEIFKFTPDELAGIRIKFKEKTYAEAFLACAELGEKDQSPDLYKKCRKAADKIEKWRSMSSVMPLGSFVWKLMIDSGYYIVVGTMPDGASGQANLRALAERAERFGNEKQASLYGFVRYVRVLRERKAKIPKATPRTDLENTVRIMTIHKSKGLEFPLVIVAGLGRRLTYTSGKNNFLMHKDLGIGLTRIEPKESWYRRTLIGKLIGRKLRREEIEEEERILYVAMTRARDLLYLTGTLSDMEAYERKKENPVRIDTTYLDMVLNILPDVRIFTLDDIDPTAFSNGSLGEWRFKKPEEKAVSLVEDPKMQVDSGDLNDKTIRDILNFQYSHALARKLKSKYSVSKINEAYNTIAQFRAGAKAGDSFQIDAAEKGFIPRTELSRPPFAEGPKQMTAADRGTIYHTFMEQIDFSRMDEGLAYVEEKAEEFVKKGLVRPEDMAKIDLMKIVNFFESDLGKRCQKAAANGCLFRERPFTLLVDVETFMRRFKPPCSRQEFKAQKPEKASKTSIRGENLAIQGIIDCYFTDGDGTILIDYKSNAYPGNLESSEFDLLMKKRYKMQIDAYRMALDEAGIGPVKETYLYLFSTNKALSMDDLYLKES